MKLTDCIIKEALHEVRALYKVIITLLKSLPGFGIFGGGGFLCPAHFPLVISTAGQKIIIIHGQKSYITIEY